MSNYSYDTDFTVVHARHIAGRELRLQTSRMRPAWPVAESDGHRTTASDRRRTLQGRRRPDAVRILSALNDAEVCVGDLAGALGMVSRRSRTNSKHCREGAWWRPAATASTFSTGWMTTTVRRLFTQGLEHVPLWLNRLSNLRFPCCCRGRDERDSCVGALEHAVGRRRRGSARRTSNARNGQATILPHYDPNLLSPEGVQPPGTAGRAQIADRFHHIHLAGQGHGLLRLRDRPGARNRSGWKVC